MQGRDPHPYQPPASYVAVPYDQLPDVGRARLNALALGLDIVDEIEALRIAGPASVGPVLISSRLYTVLKRLQAEI